MNIANNVKNELLNLAEAKGGLTTSEASKFLKKMGGFLKEALTFEFFDGSVIEFEKTEDNHLVPVAKEVV